MITNCFVHVVMYSYYLALCLKIDFKYKEWVTRSQLIQFVVCLIFCVKNCVIETDSPCHWKVRKYYLPTISTCTIYFSYLLLFIKFYIDNYLNRKKIKNNEIKIEKKKDS
jgi:hypothetical protein